MLQVVPSEIFRPRPFLLVSPSSTSTQVARTFPVHEAGGRAYEELPLPAFYRLSSLRDARYELVVPLELTIEDAAPNGFLAVNGERMMDVYGLGESPEDAVRGFAVALMDLYDDLSSREDLLSLELKKELAYLQNLIRRKHTNHASE